MHYAPDGTPENLADNDRLITEAKVVGNVDDGFNLEKDDTTTTYGYNATQQTSKTAKATYANQTLSVVSYEYILQGRVSEVVIDTYDSNSDIAKNANCPAGDTERGRV